MFDAAIHEQLRPTEKGSRYNERCFPPRRHGEKKTQGLTKRIDRIVSFFHTTRAMLCRVNDEKIACQSLALNSELRAVAKGAAGNVTTAGNEAF